MNQYMVGPLTKKDRVAVKEIDELSDFCLSWLYDDYSEEEMASQTYGWGLYKNNELIGYCSLGGAEEITDELDETNSQYLYFSYLDNLLLSDVFIKEEYRKQGLGSYMVRAAIENKALCEACLYPDSTIFLTLTNPNLDKFYTKLGFETVLSDELGTSVMGCCLDDFLKDEYKDIDF